MPERRPKGQGVLSLGDGDLFAACNNLLGWRGTREGGEQMAQSSWR